MNIDIFACILVLYFLIQLIYIYLNLENNNPKSIGFRIREDYLIKGKGRDLVGIKKKFLAFNYTYIFLGFWLFLIVIASYV